MNDSPAITSVRTSSLEPHWLATFAAGTFEGAPTLAVSLDDAAEMDASGIGLESAALWHARFAAEHSGEHSAAQAIDVMEGAAQYVTAISGALADVGCDATEQALLEYALARTGDLDLKASFSRDAEAYTLGLLAGLSARRGGIAGWEEAVELGIPPVDTLLETVQPEPQPDDLALRGRVASAVEQRNAYHRAPVDELLAQAVAPEFYRVPIALDWVQGSYTATAILFLREQANEPRATLGFNAELHVPPQGASIGVNGAALLELSGDAPCPTNPAPWVLMVPKTAVQETAGRFSADTSTIRFSDLEASLVTFGELDWLCPHSLP